MTDFLEIMCGPCAAAPKKSITIAWFTSVLFVTITFIIACLAASRASSANRAAGFAIVWTSLLCIILSVGGTLVMRKYQTPIALGYLLGVSIMMAQQSLVLFAIFAGMADESNDAMSANKAAAAFLFFLFIIYGFFSTLLTAFRSKILMETSKSDLRSPGLEDPLPIESEASTLD